MLCIFFTLRFVPPHGGRMEDTMNFFKKLSGKGKKEEENANTQTEQSADNIENEAAEETAGEEAVPDNAPEASTAVPENANGQAELPEEAKRLIEEAQRIAKDPNAQIRFAVEHKILPSKLTADPIYVITSIISEKGEYINSFFKNIYRQNKLDEAYAPSDFDVSVPYELSGANVVKIEMPEKNLFPSLCKRIYIAYSTHFTKYIYITVEAIADNKLKLGSWIDGEHEEYGVIENNEEEMIKSVIEDEEIAEGKYSNAIEKLMADTSPNPNGILTDPEQIAKHTQAFTNALMQVNKYKQEGKRDEALKLIRAVIRTEAVIYSDTPDVEHHCFRTAFDVLLYANLYHPCNPKTNEKKQFSAMQVDLSAAYLIYGAMMLEKEQFDKAIDILWKAVEANPVNVQLMFALADAYKGKNYYKSFYEIIKTAHLCAVNKVDIARIYRNFALYYIQMKEFDVAAALGYASKYFEKDPRGFHFIMNKIKEESGEEFPEPSLDDIKRKLLENGISWGAKELAVSVIKLLASQFKDAGNEQGLKMCSDMLKEATPEC